MATLGHPPIHHGEQHRFDLFELLLIVLGLALAVTLIAGLAVG
jgi:hypothetical protein